MQNVVVGIDFSAPSDNALREAARIAHWEHAKLTPLYVLDESVVDHLNPQVCRIADDVTSEASGRVLSHVEDVLGVNHGVTPQFSIGNPLRLIMRAVKDYSADLLVQGSHGMENPNVHRVGRITSRCTHKAQSNILLVRERQLGPFRNIVACIDFSPSAAKVAAQAVYIAQQDRARLSFLHIHQPMRELVAQVGYVTALAAEVLGSGTEQKTSARARESLGAFVDPIVAECGGYDFAKVVLVHPDFRQAIIDQLNRTNADLVVFGREGEPASASCSSVPRQKALSITPPARRWLSSRTKSTMNRPEPRSPCRRFLSLSSPVRHRKWLVTLLTPSEGSTRRELLYRHGVPCRRS